MSTHVHCTVDGILVRIGRTGRLGNTGRAISFYDVGTDSALSADLVKVLSDAQQVLNTLLKSMDNCL